MAKKKADGETPAAPQNPPETAAPTPPGNPPEPNGSNGGNRPAYMFSFLVQKDTYVQASIWEKKVTTRDGTFTTHEVSLRKRYRDSSTGEWKSVHSFRASELFAVAHALRCCEGWILDTRAS